MFFHSILIIIEKKVLPLHYLRTNKSKLTMKMQIRDKDFKLIAERERPSKMKAPTTFIHTLRRIGDKPALKPFVKEFAL